MMSEYAKKVRRQNILITFLVIAVVLVISFILYDMFLSDKYPFIKESVDQILKYLYQEISQ